jgi:hypothetical protein
MESSHTGDDGNNERTAITPNSPQRKLGVALTVLRVRDSRVNPPPSAATESEAVSATEYAL